MNLLLSLLPLFILGNIHCASMCGPLVALLSTHPFRWLYFLGRLLAFSLAGLFSAEMGMFLFQFLYRYHVAALFSLLCGVGIFLSGCALLAHFSLPGMSGFNRFTMRLSWRFSHLLSKRTAQGTFLFGLLTVLLPCGQTMVVFSACALEGDPLTGLGVGSIFALLTSPALIAAMHTRLLFPKGKRLAQIGLGLSIVMVGALACLRGLAELDYIPHVGYEKLHLVLY